MDIVVCVPPSRLWQFVNRHLRQVKTLDAVLYRFSDCAHLPTGFIICAQLALRWIIVIFPIILIVQTCTIAQTGSDTIQHLLNHLSGLPHCQCPTFSTSYIFLLLRNCCLCVLDSLSCHRCFSLQVFLNPLLFLFVIRKVCFLSSHFCKLLFGSQATQCT